MYCKHCGKEIADDSKFCQHCGKSLATAEEKSTDKENTRGNKIGKYVVKNKQTFLVYAIWLVLNILLYIFGQSPEYYTKNQHDYFYPFTLHDYTTLFYVGYYDITEFIVYVILIPLLLYFYINVLNKPRTSSKKKEKSNTLDNDNGHQAFETFHHDNAKIKQNEQINSEEKRRDWSLSHINGTHIPNILKPLICPFLCRGGVLLVVMFLSMMIIFSGLGLQQFYTEIWVIFLIFVLVFYPYLLLEYLNRDEAEQLFENIHNRRKVILFVSKIVLFESMFISRSGAYFVGFISLIIVDSNSSIGSSPMMQLGIWGAIITFSYIVYKYIKALNEYYH